MQYVAVLQSDCDSLKTVNEQLKNKLEDLNALYESLQSTTVVSEEQPTNQPAKKRRTEEQDSTAAEPKDADVVDDVAAANLTVSSSPSDSPPR